MGMMPNDWPGFISAVSEDFNARYVTLGDQLVADGLYANQSSFFGKIDVHPSVDIGRKDGIDVSIFFFPDGVPEKTKVTLERAMKDAFPDQGVRRRKRNRGEGLVLPIASSGDLALRELVKQTSDTLARLIEIAAPIIDADAAPEVVAAIAQGPDKLVNALLNGVEEASEGRVLTVRHLIHERSPALVGSKKASALRRDNGKLVCEGCGFDFSVHYGDRGQGFLECHHTRPVHAMVEGDITPLEDLALLCANCHRMVHTKRPWLTVPELKELVQTMRLKR